MIKCLVIFFMLLSPIRFSFFSENEIRWEQSRELTYSDFKEAPPVVTPWAATTSSEISFSYEVINNHLTHVVVYASFIPEKSWMKSKLPEVLMHEQLHFDITEVYARKLYMEVIHQSSVSKKDLTASFKSANAECQKVQQQYDDQTDHGTIQTVQAKWKEKVSGMLHSTDPYPAE
jgi:hypothetical protein